MATTTIPDANNREILFRFTRSRRNIKRLFLELLDRPMCQQNIASYFINAMCDQCYTPRFPFVSCLYNFIDERYCYCTIPTHGMEQIYTTNAFKTFSRVGYSKFKKDERAVVEEYFQNIPYRQPAFLKFLSLQNVKNFMIFMFDAHSWDKKEFYCHLFFDMFKTTIKTHGHRDRLTIYEIMLIYLCARLNHNTFPQSYMFQLMMHQALCHYKPYCDYVTNFPPSKIRACVIFEQNNEPSKKRKRWSVTELAFADEYIMKHVCRMLDISSA